MNKCNPMASCVELVQKYAPTGLVAEFGVFNGGNVWQLAELGREVWAFDTFDGLPVEECLPDDMQNPPGCFKASDETVDFLRSLPGVKVFKGRFIDTLPMIPADTQFTAIYLDCDYYLSHKQVLEYLDKHGHIGPGTVIIIDDYNDLIGTRRAIDEWRGDRPMFENNKVIYYGST